MATSSWLAGCVRAAVFEPHQGFGPARCAYVFMKGPKTGDRCQGTVAADSRWYCTSHGPDGVRRRRARARLRAARSPNVPPASPMEIQRVARWMRDGGGADAFAEFAAGAGT